MRIAQLGRDSQRLQIPAASADGQTDTTTGAII